MYGHVPSEIAYRFALVLLLLAFLALDALILLDGQPEALLLMLACQPVQPQLLLFGQPLLLRLLLLALAL